MPQQQQRNGWGNGKGSRNGSKGGKGSKNGNSNSNSKNNGKKKDSNEFQGGEPKLKGHTYDVGDIKQADKYVKTTDAVVRHIAKEYTNFPQDIKKALEELQEMDWSAIKPMAPIKQTILELEENASAAWVKQHTAAEQKLAQEYETDKAIWDEKVKSFPKRQAHYESNMTRAYDLIIGQCTHTVRDKLKARKDYDQVKGNPKLLLKALKEITHNYQDTRYSIAMVYKSIKDFFMLRQEEKESRIEHITRFKNELDIMETQHGIFKMQSYVKRHPEYDQGPTQAKKTKKNKEIETDGYNQLVAYAYMRSCDRKFSSKLDEDLSNGYARGKDEFPQDLIKSVEMMSTYRDQQQQIIEKTRSCNRGKLD